MNRTKIKIPINTIDMALNYAEKGLSVIPIVYNGKYPVIENWVRECSTNPKKIHSWFDNRQLNIGIVTGKVSNIVVIDIDTKDELDGRKSIALKQAELDCYLPDTVTATTQSGGVHMFYKYPIGQKRITGHVGILPQVDIRADGNQVVVYPSVGKKGVYSWINSPIDTKMATLPKAWINFICDITEDNGKIKIPKRAFKLPKKIEQGMRHATLLSYACSLSHKGKSITEISASIREANRTLCVVPINDDVELDNISNWSREKEDSDNPTDNVDLPIWVNVDAKNIKTIDEPNFILWYKKEYELLCINGMFYDGNGLIDNSSLKQDIQNLISPFINTGLGYKVRNLLEALKNECFFKLPTLRLDTLNLLNTSLRINENGVCEVTPNFTLNRLNVKYDENAKCPMWDSFVYDLLEEEDVKTLQEYIGYCLVPTTIAQKALFIIGKGREGKSVIGEVMHAIFNNSMVQGKVHKLQENRFMLAQLENKLVFYDDDLQSQALKDTGTFKTIVTATIPILVERKGEPHYEMQPYARIIASGNKPIEACYDHSDGFYRRLLLLHCKERGQRNENKLLAKDIINTELSGIINWAIKGLKRLVLQRWEFSISDGARNMLIDAEEESNTFLAFMRDDSIVVFDKKQQVSSMELYDTYKKWCDENALAPLAMRTVSGFLKENSTKFNLTYSNKVHGTKRGYKGIRLKAPCERVAGFKLYTNKEKKRG